MVNSSKLAHLNKVSWRIVLLLKLSLMSSSSESPGRAGEVWKTQVLAGGRKRRRSGAVGRRVAVAVQERLLLLLKVLLVLVLVMAMLLDDVG